MNVILDKPGGWPEFRNNLIPDEITKIMIDFDYTSVSAKIMKKLSTFVENNDFKIAAVENNNAASKGICQWILSIYELNMKNIQLNDLLNKFGKGSSYTTLSEYLVKNSFYMFCWPAYFANSKELLQKITDDNNVIINAEKLNSLVKEKFISVSNYLTRYSDVISGSHKNLCENFAISEAARVLNKL